MDDEQLVLMHYVGMAGIVLGVYITNKPAGGSWFPILEQNAIIGELEVELGAKLIIENGAQINGNIDIKKTRLSHSAQK